MRQFLYALNISSKILIALLQTCSGILQTIVGNILLPFLIYITQGITGQSANNRKVPLMKQNF